MVGEEGKALGRGAKVVVWVVAVVAMAVIAVYQRRTGPTYPLSVKEAVGGVEVSGKLVRTHAGPGGPSVEIKAPPPVQGVLAWRRYPTQDPLTRVPMKRTGDLLAAPLPHFPRAAKVEYTLELSDGQERLPVPAEPAVLRYRDEVPGWVFVPHLVFIFLGLLIGMRLTLAAILNETGFAGWLRWLIPVLLVGGFVFGPLMSKFAFGEYWTGWPLGKDLTDTKTLLTFVVWLLAWPIAVRWPQARRAAVLVAAAVMLAVYLVPHSVSGSQLDWSKQPASGSSAGPPTAP